MAPLIRALLLSSLLLLMVRSQNVTLSEELEFGDQEAAEDELQAVEAEDETAVPGADGDDFLMTPAELAAASAKMTCVKGKRDFNPLIHRQKYRIAIHATRGLDAAQANFGKLFQEYLTATAGQRFNPPVEFEAVAMSSWDLQIAADEESVDFFYANSGWYSCMGLDYGAQPLATTVSRQEVRGRSFDLDVYGGVIATRFDRDDINTIEDLKDKIIGAGSISMFNAAQTQMYQMVRAGLSWVMDPKQVVFTHNQAEVVTGILSGEFDVGFVPTDEIERYKDENGNPIDTDLFKILNPKIYVMDDGALFPFLHSTDIYPNWPFAGFPWAGRDISEEVQQALLALSEHHIVGDILNDCIDEKGDENQCGWGNDGFNARLLDEGARCDSTKELIELAVVAAEKAGLAGFRPSRSYFEVRSMQQGGGFLEINDRGRWQCTKADTFYDGINCPVGHYKLGVEDFHAECGKMGLECKEGRDCYCKPCLKAFEVDIYPHEDGAEDFHDGDYTGDAKAGCDKMSLCGVAEQTMPIKFRAYDNTQRENAVVKVLMHLGRDTQELPVNRVNNTWAYEFTWTENSLGVGIMEVFVNDIQVPESPIRVQVVERECDIDYPGQGKVPTTDGVCECGKGTIVLGEKCFSAAIFYVIIAIVVLVFILIIGGWYLNFKRKQSDQMWLVNIEELHFDDPVEVIGQGSFGVVLLAEYRGTKVAIKRVIDNNQRKKGGSRAGGSRGSIEAGGSKDLASSQEGSVQEVDLEAQSKESADTGGLHSLESGSGGGYGMRSGGSMNKSGTASADKNLDFLGDLSFGYGKPNKWQKMFPWLFPQDDFRLKSNILGSASGASTTQKSVSARLCPYFFDPHAKRKREFIVEMRLLSRLRHPCITTVMGAVVCSSTEPMLCMEYMEYGSLHDLLRNETMHTGGEIILQILRDVSQGLRFLHSSKPPILHGDLKAKNILIDSRFRAKVADFGLSTKKKNGLSGTPYFMAPEYLRGKTDYNCPCDIYSLAIIIWEIYARENPYQGENPRKVLRKICDPRHNKRPEIPKACPPKVLDVMKKAWSPDPFFRPQAKDLDLIFMDCSARDVEPLEDDEAAGAFSKAARGEATGDMLYEIFPKKVADQLKAGQKVEPEQHDNTTVCFSDIVHFQDIVGKVAPMKVNNMLGRLYDVMDQCAKKHQVFKVETVGDSWMGVTNLENNQDDTHVKCIAEFAIAAIEEASQIMIDEDDPKLGYVRLRFGFHSGAVVSNVIGSLNPRYCLFGDTVNTASRMESNSFSRRIHCSEKSAELLMEQAPEIPRTKRGKVHVKGKGDMVTYWIGDLKKHVDESERNHVDFKEAP